MLAAGIAIFMCWLVLSNAELVRIKHQPRRADGSIRFLVVGDWGRRGAFNQSRVATQMGRIGWSMGIDFVISTGDNFYNDGLKDVNDPAFAASFTRIYTSRGLQRQWYSVLGNHDYRGNARAQLSPVLRKRDTRWLCLRSFIVNAGVADIFFIDTTPFVQKYFLKTERHTYDWRGLGSIKTYIRNLLSDLDSALNKSTATRKIVVGHHPIRNAGHHGDTKELQQLLPILKARKVDFYVNGHEHCLQHISDTRRSSKIQFFTSGAGSKAWRGYTKGLKRPDLKFFYDGQGFMSVNLGRNKSDILFYDINGKVLHRYGAAQQVP
ncbi:hypothetical protein Dimus_027788 [Dionaea muscipula]